MWLTGSDLTNVILHRLAINKIYEQMNWETGALSVTNLHVAIFKHTILTYPKPNRKRIMTIAMPSTLCKKQCSIILI